ncbi:hypothetical protein D3C87_1735580 [compost metagenome]
MALIVACGMAAETVSFFATVSSFALVACEASVEIVSMACAVLCWPPDTIASIELAASLLDIFVTEKV